MIYFSKIGGNEMSDEEILIKYFGGKPQWNGTSFIRLEN